MYQIFFVLYFTRYELRYPFIFRSFYYDEKTYIFQQSLCFGFHMTQYVLQHSIIFSLFLL